MRLYAGRGRKKEECEGKLSGGNEFISREIRLQTGKLIDRKKVSSHIQVLKGLLKDNPKCRFSQPFSLPRDIELMQYSRDEADSRHPRLG